MLLIHGGLWEDMDADRFWGVCGITAELERRGLVPLAPDRLPRASAWMAEVDHLVSGLPDRPLTVVAGSNGCSVAVRLALACPERVGRLVLAWPATAGDAAVDAWTRAQLTGLGAASRTIDGLLAGETLRGVTDSELAALAMPVGVLASTLGNPFHQRRTVDALLSRLPGAVELTGFPEPSPAFAGHAEAFVDVVVGFCGSSDALGQSACDRG